MGAVIIDEYTMIYLSALLGMYLDLSRRIKRIEKFLNGELLAE